MLILFIGINFLSCASGPEPRVCQPIPAAQEFACYDKREDLHYDLKYDETDGYRCRTIEDQRVYSNECAQKRCVKDLELSVCTSRPQTAAFDCQRANGSKFTVSMNSDDVGGYLCMPEVDFDTYGQYCEEFCK